MLRKFLINWIHILGFAFAVVSAVLLLGVTLVTVGKVFGPAGVLIFMVLLITSMVAVIKTYVEF